MENLLNYLTLPIILLILLGLVCVLLGRAVKIGFKHRDTHINMEVSGRDERK